MRNEDNNNKFKEKLAKYPLHNNSCFQVKSYVLGTDSPKLLGVKNHPH